MSLLRQLFYVPRYRQDLILGSSKSGALWEYSTWSDHVFPQLDSLIQELGCSPSVHCRQISKEENKPIDFGRIKWSSSGAKTWCHGSPVTRSKSDAWLFEDFEVFCPARGILIREKELPELYVQLLPMVPQGESTATEYDQGLLVVMKKKSYEQNADVVDRTILSLASAVQSVGVYSSEGRVSSLNAFESLVMTGFMYRGMLGDSLPDTGRMKGRWTRVDVQAPTSPE
jgi:hypothetical protein